MDCEKSSTVLHWNYRGFTKFPIEHLRGEEDDVTDIYLKENLISRVPNDIGKLRNLESLYLTGNDITELPREISQLRRLKCLDVSGNRLRGIPDEIGELRELKFLILDENELRDLPLRIAELRALRYLSVCDNKLQWLPQRPVYNYFHCEFKFWRNPDLKTIPYSLWYHMFRDQQTRSLNIGCLNITEDHRVSKNRTCRLKIHQECGEYEIDINCPPQHNNIVETGSQLPPSLYELTKRVAYQMISTTIKQYTTYFSIYSDKNSYYLNNNKNYDPLSNLEKTFNNFEIDNNVETFSVSKNEMKPANCTEYLYTKNERRNYYVPKDIIEKCYSFLPYFIKNELSIGPISKCDNAYCKKPIFDYVIYEFCIEKIILIESTADVILNANFCSKSCADFWKLGKQNMISWRLLNQ
ncbi:Leucine-rich repeat protein soc-2-like [Papilio machaon]|uniref:Leucine-rich repeat protein soc-2-like n=1 Tax=Papilio machaon TaxID=76193 RepID=A0A0N1PHX5_PAPMA|nr:Leucine-rich repeat protein soc-2-like [Papilio machaon]